MNLVVVHTPSTHHVVGALSGTGLPKAPELADLIGSGGMALHVPISDRDVATVLLPSDVLATATVPDRPGVLTDPMTFALITPETGAPRLNLLDPWLVGTAGPADIELSQTMLTVDLPASVTEDTAIFAAISGLENPILDKVPENANSIELPVAVEAGFHGVLVLVAGRFGQLRMIEVM